MAIDLTELYTSMHEGDEDAMLEGAQRAFDQMDSKKNPPNRSSTDQTKQETKVASLRTKARVVRK